MTRLLTLTDKGGMMWVFVPPAEAGPGQWSSEVMGDITAWSGGRNDWGQLTE